MRAQVRERNDYRRAGRMLLDTAHLHRRQRAIDLVGQRASVA